MKIFLFFLCCSFSKSLYAQQALTVERIFQSPELEGTSILNLQFSPKGNRLSFLKPKTENYEILDLWEYDLKTGAPQLLVDSNSLKFGKLSEEEKARRERQRISQKGIVEYYWSNDGQRLVFPAAGALYLYTIENKKLKLVADSKTNAIDVRFSPKDSFVSYVSDKNLVILNSISAKKYQVTNQGKGTISFGVAEFIAQEEMDRYTGYWWSQDEKYLALTKVDESGVKVVDRYDIDADKVVVHKERYPEAGSKNAIVQLAVVSMASVLTGKPQLQWIPLGKNKDIYLADAVWSSDGELIYQVQSRDQKRLDVFSYDPRTKKNKLLFYESDSKWINLHSSGWMLKKSSRFIWTSEKTGFKHLYLYTNKGEAVSTLTQGEWPVDALIGVDEDGGWVYFTAGMKTALEKHVYRVKLESPGAPEMLTQDIGWHNATMSGRADIFVDTYSTSLNPVQVILRKGNGEKISALSSNEVIDGHPLFPFKKSLIEPEFGSFKNAVGETIYFSLYKPPGFDAKKKYPLVVTGYGGPGVQMVNRGWVGKRGLFSQVLLQKGFVVATFDNRGSARRGKKFEDYLKNAFGTVEVEDQVSGVQHLISQGFIDSKRVGFSGWSYGGYLATNLILKAPDVFSAVVAGAPVTDFALYDTHYTERYMGKPQEQVEAYRKANVLNFVDKLVGNLLVIHGMADDNVLFTNSTMLFKRLQKSGKLFESVTYPGAKHGVYGKENQTHLYSTIADFFERRLKP